MRRRIGYKPLMAAALAGLMALSAAPATAQPRHGDRGHDRGWHGGGRGHGGYDRGPSRRGYDRGYHRGGGYGRRDNSGAVIGGALLGLGILGGALALQQSQVAPPPAYYAPPDYDPPPAYAPPPGYYGYK
ncbi:hypothetical protein EJV46_00435 [Roseococcus sp. SYP-B2431]|uniref:hypothetical protein n=1 Tax=Roseococcus sp. SYP-B2431 TaxID=2496640 RepID=UPI00103BC1A7|nr:hypothetical protein [Roseococcus sp. SYP-B2431]TCI00959.1 hypothetical protein EJV46_00435 [Roseococcus sp. SYP-B2431]